MDANRIEQAIHAHGFGSVKNFADSLGLHRNTVGNYLAGKTGLPTALGRILNALDLTPADVLSLSLRHKSVPGLSLTDLIEDLHVAVPGAAFVLFGSRARGTAKPYSDYDIGVYHIEGMEFAIYSRLLDIAADWNDDSIVAAQLVDLGRADASFVHAAADDLTFLAGSYAAWCGLLRKAGMRLYE